MDTRKGVFMKDLPGPVLAFYSNVFNDLDVRTPCFKTTNKRMLLHHDMSYTVNHVRNDMKNYVLNRLQSEGISFISYSLPSLGKAVEISLITGKVLDVPFTFGKRYSSQLPAFMYVFFRTLFDDNGVPLWTLADCSNTEQDAAYALFALRQVLLAFSKASDLGTLMSNEEAMKAFSLRIAEQSVITTPSWVLNQARKLLKEVLMEGDELNPMLAQWVTEPFGRHGPGAVAGKEKGFDKWNFKRINGLDMKIYNLRQNRWDSYSHQFENGYIRQPFGVADPYSRAVQVPKDYRGPRTICIEPKEFQFAQQGLWSVLQSIIEKHPLTRRSINFRHQEYNSRLCKRQDLCTIDLKDASDTVSLKLCRILLPRQFFKLVTRYRSRKISIDGKLTKSTCFASMGSALCFPIETLIFWAIAQASTHPCDRRMPLRVFGDDIIVPRGSTMFIVKMLEASGFKVNKGKTCIDTPIRESCGAFMYSGIDVRVTRFKVSACRDLPSWSAFLSNARELYQNKLSETARAMLLNLKEFWHVPFGYLGLPSHPIFTCQKRWNSDLQRYELRQPSVVMTKGRGAISWEPGIYAWLMGNSTKPHTSGTERLKVCWVESTL